MIIVAIDSSADSISVAVLRGREPLAVRAYKASRPRSEAALGVVEEMLADAELTLDAVDLLAVATGPGSFNGIRGGIATAEGLGLALGRPVVGIPTLDAVAYAHVGRAPVLLALLPAGRDDYYAASYNGSMENWGRRGEYTVGPLPEALAALPSDALVCGSVPAGGEALVAGAGLRRAPLFAELPRALSAGALAVAQAGRGGVDADRAVQPLYLRRPGITQPGRPIAASPRATRVDVEHAAGAALPVPPGGGE